MSASSAQDAARVCVVTGASAGIGAATALAFGRRGWAVALGARGAERLAATAAEVARAGGRPFAAALDVSEPASIESFFDAAEKELGPAQVVVSNAGTCVPGLLHELTPEDIAAELRTNLLGPLLVARRALPGMLARRRGDLVFVSSQNAVAPRPFQVGYTAAKWGVEGLARALDMELEGSGVRASVVRPGPTQSAFGQGWDAGIIRRILGAWKYWGVQRHLQTLPPESVAEAIVSVALAPSGTHLRHVEVMPEGPPREKA